MKRVVVFLVALAACSVAAGQECKRGEGSDKGWQDFTQRNPHKDIKALLASNKTEAAAEVAFGKPQKALQHGAQSETFWVYGASREGRECNSTGHFESTYMVQYAIVEASFAADQLTSCNVRFRVFIGKEPKPDPFSKGPLPDEVTECSKF